MAHTLAPEGGKEGAMREDLKKRFEELFQRKGEMFFFSPSRINLIGEHIDYNGGKVLPAAIALGTYGVAARREDHRIELYSENLKSGDILSLGDLETKKNGWTDYVAVCFCAGEAGYPSRISCW